MRSGAGLATLAVPESLHDLMEVKLTEVMTRPVAETRSRTLSRKGARQVLEMSGGFDAVALGPGLSTEKETVKAVRELVSGLEQPLVLDADGLNAFTGDAGALTERKAPLVVTPHPGEMSRLTGEDPGRLQADRLGTAGSAAVSWGAVVVLKGAGTVVAEPGGAVRIATTGNPGMASAGMGDVLTGCIAAMLAQGAEPFDAAALGVHLHGLAADILAGRRGTVGMMAMDVVMSLPLAILAVKGSTER
jgi:NAD(P)H-hydrate epimerase